jgi:hypothetical protein
MNCSLTLWVRSSSPTGDSRLKQNTFLLPGWTTRVMSQTDEETRNEMLALGISLGGALGISLGLMMNNLALGLSIGMGCGIAIGAGLMRAE